MIFSLFMHTFSRYCNYNVFRHVDRFLFGARDAGVFELWFTRYLKKRSFCYNKTGSHFMIRINSFVDTSPIDKYGMTAIEVIEKPFFPPLQLNLS